MIYYDCLDRKDKIHSYGLLIYILRLDNRKNSSRCLGDFSTLWEVACPTVVEDKTVMEVVYPVCWKDNNYTEVPLLMKSFSRFFYDALP